MYDVELVIPVYNEAACITIVLDDWVKELDRLGISYRMIVLNDGSKDNTAEILSPYRDNPKVNVINKKNSGHGPTILQGYQMAIQEAHWVFQVDSDNEMKAEHFKKVWYERANVDAVIGIREGRHQPLPRKIVSFFSRLIVTLFYGRGIIDVNCPFRLLRADVLAPILKHIHQDTFAPNVAISGILALRRMRLKNIPIPHTERQTGEVSLKKWKLMKAAMKSFLQVVMIRFDRFMKPVI
jgi:glycosyltransferase involved in cell wall biosynthesis